MKIGIIGTIGRVGTALQTGWTRAGHDVRLIGRSSPMTPADLGDWAHILAFAIPFSAVEG